MKIRYSFRNVGIAFGIVSLSTSLIIFMLILNWFFQITPYQRLEGLPIMMPMFTSPIGVVLGFLSIKIYPNKIGKWGIISSIILFVMPFLYWYLGTLILGP